ncbi:hypothetical protein [Streptomyces sp. NPDC002324]
MNNTKRVLAALVLAGAALTMVSEASAADGPIIYKGDNGYVCIRVPNGNGGSYRVCGPLDNFREYLTPQSNQEED